MTQKPPMTLPLHTAHEFDEELDALKSRLLSMGARCERMLDLVIRAYADRSSTLAAEVMRMDKEMNVDELRVDDMAVRLLALRQPMGRDLRFVMLAVKAVTDLERIGDEAVNLAERVHEMVSDGNVPPPSSEIPDMARKAAFMLRTALDAFVEEDADGAIAVLAMDDQVDELYGRILNSSIAYMELAPSNVRSGMKSASCAKYVERIADHATNLAEMVVYLVRGVDVRHKGSR